MSVHEGHRERIKETFDAYGLDCFNDINALELLLFYAIPRRDTNPIAHALMQKFGSLDEIFSASEQELMDVPGVGKNAATLIRLIPAMMRKSEISKVKDYKIIHNSHDAGTYLVPRFMNEKIEVLWMMCLDDKKQLILCQEMGRGVSYGVETNIRRLAETALRCKCTYVIVAHNHPNGIALPSREDDLFTRKLYEALRAIDIQLADHIIVTGKDFVSLADSGAMCLPRY